jgi:hypothetical protein
MTQMLVYAVAVVVLAALVLLVRSPRFALAGFLAFSLGTWAAAVDGLGEPKPIWLEWRDLGEIEVAGTQFSPNEAIYLWTRTTPPLAYALPWSDDAARRLQEAERKANDEGAPGLIVKRGATYGELSAHPIPPQPDPPK